MEQRDREKLLTELTELLPKRVAAECQSLDLHDDMHEAIWEAFGGGVDQEADALIEWLFTEYLNGDCSTAVAVTRMIRVFDAPRDAVKEYGARQKAKRGAAA